MKTTGLFIALVLMGLTSANANNSFEASQGEDNYKYNTLSLC